jgi:hypothetical protein
MAKHVTFTYEVAKRDQGVNGLGRKVYGYEFLC